MIQEFSVQNFLSFQEKQTISFVATSDKKLLDELTCEPKPGGIKLLKMMMLYGANASGKSNLLNAIEALWSMLFHPQTEEHKSVDYYIPFALTKDKPTEFNVVFWANGRRFQYDLVYDSYTIIYEKMMYTTDKDVLALMYKREYQKISFGSTLGIKVKQRDEFIKETLKNHTLLSSLNKKNLDVPVVLKDLYEWIKENVHELSVHNDGLKIAVQAENNSSLKRLIIDLMGKADFNITDFSVTSVAVPDTVVDILQTRNDLPDYLKNQLLKPREQIFFKHTTQQGEEFQIDFKSESTGTRAYFRLARILYDLRKGGSVFLEDELDNALHYDLLIHYLQTYIQYSCNSQLIFATHNQQLMDEDWMIRRDMVWIVEKDRDTAASSLERVSDMGIHKNLSLKNAYSIGKLGGKPILSSTLFLMED